MAHSEEPPFYLNGHVWYGIKSYDNNSNRLQEAQPTARNVYYFVWQKHILLDEYETHGEAWLDKFTNDEEYRLDLVERVWRSDEIKTAKDVEWFVERLGKAIRNPKLEDWMRYRGENLKYPPPGTVTTTLADELPESLASHSDAGLAVDENDYVSAELNSPQPPLAAPSPPPPPSRLPPPSPPPPPPEARATSKAVSNTQPAVSAAASGWKPKSLAPTPGSWPTVSQIPSASTSEPLPSFSQASETPKPRRPLRRPPPPPPVADNFSLCEAVDDNYKARMDILQSAHLTSLSSDDSHDHNAPFKAEMQTRSPRQHHELGSGRSSHTLPTSSFSTPSYPTNNNVDNENFYTSVTTMLNELDLAKSRRDARRRRSPAYLRGQFRLDDEEE